MAAFLPKFAMGLISNPMTTMNISLPDALKAFVDEQVEAQGFGSSSEYVRALIRRDLEREQLRRLLLDGAESALTAPVDDAYFQALRARAAGDPGP
ncbi:type II toxin-antitoxin system ParD family antitoxin [Zavarzinia sp.]|uniref:type II toxin-antitoxin system ParD family antitoxin n=1 Tax=Zavarzinia sp. TaxID=2027920 RepID=UPI003BB5140F|nr:type II toxin-antitoxin system ParD family antitoxin [Zavarzinia sp.]